MNWNFDTRSVQVRYNFDPSLSEEEKIILRNNGVEWAKVQCEAERKAFHECKQENIWTAAYRCLDVQQSVHLCVGEKLTTEAIRKLELELIKKREARVEEKKQKERERQLDREFVEFAHKFRQHKTDLKNQQDTPK